MALKVRLKLLRDLKPAEALIASIVSFPFFSVSISRRLTISTLASLSMRLKLLPKSSLSTCDTYVEFDSQAEARVSSENPSLQTIGFVGHYFCDSVLQGHPHVVVKRGSGIFPVFVRLFTLFGFLYNATLVDRRNILVVYLAVFAF